MVKLSSKFYSLVPGVIVCEGIELFSSNSCCHQVDHSVITAISKRCPSPSLLIHNGLEFLFRHVGSWINGATVADDDRGRFTHLSQASEIILSVHLESDEETLKFDSFLHVELGHKDHTSCLYNKGGYFWD